MEFRDYYATLGVTKTASGKEIKQAYRKLARKFHPDVNPGDAKAEQRFKEINEAYEVLGDAEKRKKYDELGANWRLYEQMPPGYGAPGGTGGFDGWTVNTGPGATVFSTDDLNDMLGGENSPFSDFFQAFFGGQAARPKGGRSAPRRRPGSDVEQDVTLSLDEAFHGTTRRLGIKTRGHSRTVDVRIPPGVKDGARVRLQGEGEAGLGGARSGDLFLRVHLQAHDTFERRGQDLHVRITIPLLTAVLGGEAEVPTLGGRALRLKIPETTQNGQAFRLRGHGMPAAGRPGEVGDLYVTVEVQLPRQLSADERTHYEALKHLES